MVCSKILEFERLLHDYRVAFETYLSDPSDFRFVKRYLVACNALLEFVCALLSK